jgi:hypothetical protein
VTETRIEDVIEERERMRSPEARLHWRRAAAEANEATSIR